MIPRQNKLILLISEAIAHYEGFYDPAARAHRNNNPGNLRGWSSRTPKDDQGFDIFESRKEGFLALYQQVEKNVIERELTLLEFFAGKEDVYRGYAARVDGNDPEKYASYVQTFIGDRGFTPISVSNTIIYWWKSQLGKENYIEQRELLKQLKNELTAAFEDVEYLEKLV